MTSHASVNVMLALEDAFDIEFPESHAEEIHLRVDRRHPGRVADDRE